MGGDMVADTRKKTGRTGIEFRPAWEWPDEAEDLLVDEIEDAPGPVVNVCSGSSTIGDLNVDLMHPRADVHADARDLPLGDETVGTVVMDPPWTIDHLVERHRFVCEAGRVLRVGGVLLVYAPWIPRPTWAELEDIWVRTQTRYHLPQAPRTISRWRKVSTRRRKHEEARARGKVDGERPEDPLEVAEE